MSVVEGNSLDLTVCAAVSVVEGNSLDLTVNAAVSVVEGTPVLLSLVGLWISNSTS